MRNLFLNVNASTLLYWRPLSHLFEVNDLIFYVVAAVGVEGRYLGRL